jgi:hypothetical protein
VVALDIARAFDDLASAWTGLERQRLARDYLTNATPGNLTEMRDLPIAVTPTYAADLQSDNGRIILCHTESHIGMTSTSGLKPSPTNSPNSHLV